MPAPHGGPSLPSELLKQLGVGPSENGGSRGRKFHTQSQSRKDRRKQERQGRKGHQNGAARTKPIIRLGGNKNQSAQSQRGRPGKAAAPKASRTAQVQEDEPFAGFDSDNDIPDDDVEADDYDSLDEDTDGDKEEDAPLARMSKADRERMVKDDAEIARLEKKLGMKGKKALPKSFQEDGLGDLMDDLDGDSDSESDYGKRKRKTIDDGWLAQKRRKLGAASQTIQPTAAEDDEDSEDDDDLSMGSGMSEDDLLDELGDSDDLDGMGGESDEDLDGDSGDGTDEEDEDEPREKPRQRENPYVAPVTASSTKYVPPSRRMQVGSSDAEALKLTQRKAQGLVNRLTEANLISILADIEKLYQDSPRQYATDAIVNTFMAQLTDRSSLQATMLILYAGFATAVYKVIGSDFGAHLVQRTVDEFKTHYGQAKAESVEHQPIAKQPSNLLVFMAQLYLFRMIGSKVIVDYVRMLLAELSELNAELLLQILRHAGQRLRSEDPLALKDILGLIRPAVERAGGKDNISVRTQFMIETMYDLKNNKTKSRTDPSHAQNLDHATRLNKALGSLNTRRLKATEPLRVSLDDLEQSDKRGKWWLVGASWAGADSTKESGATPAAHQSTANEEHDPESDGDADYFPGIPDLQKLNELAKAEGMNTDARYSIFRSLLVSADSQEAYLRLQRLRLNKIERREIPSVIIQCSGSEVKYNPFYTEVARRVCNDHKVQWGFQDALWKLFKRVGETLFDEDNGEDDLGDDDDLDVERLTNVGLMYGGLIAQGVLGIRILKCLNFAMLRPKTQAAVQAIIIGILREKLKLGKGKKGKKGDSTVAIKEPFLAVNDRVFAQGLKYFLKKVVRKAKEVKKSKTGLSQALALAEEALVEVEAREAD